MVEAALALGRYLFLALLVVLLQQIYRVLARSLDPAPAGSGGAERREPRLVALAGSGMVAPGRTYPLDAELTIGRHKDNSIVIDDGFCSGRHARVWFDGEQAWIEDLGSTNGTLVEQQRLVANEPLALAPRARVVLGGTILRFEP